MLKKLIFLLLLTPAILVQAADVYVSTRGNDLNDGSSTAPKATLSAALRQARELRRVQAPGSTEAFRIVIEEGVYPLSEAVRLRPEDSGSEASPLLIEGKGKAIISGGISLNGWKKSGKLWVTRVPDFNGRPTEFRQLWVNGRRAVRSRDVSDFEHMHRINAVDNRNEVVWVPAEAVKAIQKAPYAEMVLHQMWAVSILRIKSITIQGDSAAVRFHQPESTVQFMRPWPRPMIAPGRNSAFYLTNARELLDQPGEWYYDLNKQELWYYPLQGENMANAEVVAPMLDQLVVVEGTLDRPVQHVQFKNVQFCHAAWQRPSTHGHVPLQAGMHLSEGYRMRPIMVRPDNNHKLDNQGFLVRPSAAVTVRSANHIDFTGCRFEHNGHTGLDYEAGTRGGIVAGSVFRDLGGNGLTAGSFSPPAHETHLPYVPNDLRELCSALQVSDNLFTDVANDDWGTVAILAGYVNNINIVHNEISDVSYSGISLGWGWNQTVNTMHNNRVHANHIHHYGKQMYDVAGIYTLGAQPKSVISNNAIHSIYNPGFVHDPNHWFYLYTDEGSSFITVRNNHVPSEKFLQNANGPNNLWINNHPFVHDSVKQQAGIRFADFPALKNELPVTDDSRVNTVPDYFLIGFSGNEPDIQGILRLAFHNGVSLPRFYRWNNHWVMYGLSNRKQQFYQLVTTTYPDAAARLYETPLYTFNRKQHCGQEGCVTEWEHIIYTAQLVDDIAKQEQYVQMHKEQWEKWPEVSEGFCKAQFQQLQVYRNGRQLMLIISIPKGEDLDELNKLTTADNPRVDEWNRIMQTLQTGIDEAAPGEVWVKFTPVNHPTR
jgi:L-rhamnose mutarotase